MIKRALERGLAIADFEIFTIGMLLDYVITYNEVDEEAAPREMKATQSDFDAF